MRGEKLDGEVIVETPKRKWDAMQYHLDERGRRIWAASEAEALGHGGITIVYSDRRSRQPACHEARLPGELRKRLIRKTPRRLSGHGWQAAVEKKIGEKSPRYKGEPEGQKRQGRPS